MQFVKEKKGNKNYKKKKKKESGAKISKVIEGYGVVTLQKVVRCYQLPA